MTTPELITAAREGIAKFSAAPNHWNPLDAPEAKP